MKPLIPILGTVLRGRHRREKDWKLVDNWFRAVYNKADSDSNIGRIMEWIDEFTAGRFYLDLYMVAFEDEQDFVIFQLWYKNEDV